MSVSLSASRDDLREIPMRTDRPGSTRVLLLGITVVITVALIVALASPQSQPAFAGSEPQNGSKVQAPDPANHSALTAKIRWTLKNQHDRMINLANQPPGSPRTLDKLRDQYLNQSITTESAKANFDNVRLNREVAEIGVTEYAEGIFVQDKAVLEGEAKLAESDLNRARDSIDVIKDRLAQIKKASKGSTSDLSHEFGYEDALAQAQNRLPRAEMAFKQAQTKLKTLVEYTKPLRLKELGSEVEKARADELAKKAEWEVQQAKLKKLNEAIKAENLRSPEQNAVDLLARQARASLERAISIEGQIQTKLEQLTKNGKRDDPLQKEIEDLTNQLDSVIVQAEVERSAALFAALKTKIHSAASR
jgi:uncharacterized protein YigA (DUF484 family)